MAASSNDVPPLAKFLASTDKKTRDKAVKNLAVFLSNKSENAAISELEMAKLWKGIFYCFWMSDKPLVQQALASELADLLLAISDPSSSLHFLRGFWVTIVREWNGIDRLRMDKFYMLVRRFVNASFRLLLRTQWDESFCMEYNEILTSKAGGPLCPTDIRVPASLPFHLGDIYLDELNKVLADAPTSPCPLSTLLSPFFTLAAGTPAKLTFKHIQETIFEPILAALQSPSLNAKGPVRKRARLESDYQHILDNSCTSDPKSGPVDHSKLKATLLRRLFDIASEEGTRDSNRRKMYTLFKASKAEEEEEEDSESDT